MRLTDRREQKKATDIFDLEKCSEYKMLVHLSLPIILSLLVQGMYNMVDSIYLSRLGEEVLSAISLSSNVQNLATFLFTGIATGMNALVSKALGAGEIEHAKRALVNGCLLQFCVVFLFFLFGAFGVHYYFSSSASDMAVIGYGMAYLQPCMLLSVTMAAQIIFERSLQATGLSRYMFICQAVGFGVNIALDPIMIFGLGFVPALGVRGAAYATLIGQALAAALAVTLNFNKNGVLFNGILSKNRIHSKDLIRILYLGVSAAAVGIVTSIGNYYINRILIGFSTTANATFGLHMKLENFALIPRQGISAGLVTMIAFFYGKRNFERMRKTITKGLLLIFTWSVVCTVALMGFPTLLLQPFDPSPQMLAIGIPALRVIGMTHIPSGCTRVLNAFFQATGKAGYSMAYAFVRQFVARIPAAYLLSQFGHLELIWWCWPISEVVSDLVCVICFLLVFRSIRRLLRPPPGSVVATKV